MKQVMDYTGYIVRNILEQFTLYMYNAKLLPDRDNVYNRQVTR